jgi:hypothetical protein
MYDAGELAGYSNVQSDCWIAVHGHIVDYTALRTQHTAGGVTEIDAYCGGDASELFPLTASYCGFDNDGGTPHDDTFNSTYGHKNSIDIVDKFFHNKKTKLWKGYLAFRLDDIKTNHAKASSPFIVIDGNVYNMKNYIEYDMNFLGAEITRIILPYIGQDASKAFQKSKESAAAIKCMNKMVRSDAWLFIVVLCRCCGCAR